MFSDMDQEFKNQYPLTSGAYCLCAAPRQMYGFLVLF